MTLIDFVNSYQTPGVYIEQLPAAVVNTVGIEPTVIGFVGDTQRYATTTEIHQLTGTTAVLLVQQGVNVSSVVVTDRFTGVTYINGTDYTLVTTAGASGAESATTTIARLSGSNMPTGNYAVINYQYTNLIYFQVQTFTEYNYVQSAYGPPFTSNGTINSSVTLGAYLAFLNGASTVVISPLNPASSGAVPMESDWQNAITLLESIPTVNTIVPLTSDLEVHQMVNAACTALFTNQQYAIGFVGQTFTAAPSAFIAEATGYGYSRMVVVGPGQAQFYLGPTGQILNLEGEYLAAAVAGLYAGQSVQTPITNKLVQGFFSITNQVTTQQMITLQSNGVCWVWQNRNGAIVVRHGLTTNMTNIYTREISIQGAQDRLCALLLDTLNTSGIIGSVFNSTTQQAALSAVIGALEEASNIGLINDYSNVQYRQPSNIPTLLQVQFMYQPALPLNYIEIDFQIDTSTGASSFTAYNPGGSVPVTPSS